MTGWLALAVIVGSVPYSIAAVWFFTWWKSPRKQEPVHMSFWDAEKGSHIYPPLTEGKTHGDM